MDYDFYDYILLMDKENQWGVRRIIHEDPDLKIHLILEYVKAPSFHNRDGSPRDVADPWYTHDFERTYKDLYAGCEGLLEYLTRETVFQT